MSSITNRIHTKPLMNILVFCVLGSILTGCGPHGSLAWHVGTSQADKDASFNRMSTVGLCNYWASNYPGGRPQWATNREAVGAALERRGLSPMYCANPTQDDVSIANQQAAEAQARADQARRQKEQACQAARRALNQCMQTPNMSCYTLPAGC